MSKSSEDTFCSEQKLIFGDYTRRWACRARRYQEVRVLYTRWCSTAGVIAPLPGPIIALSSSSAPRGSPQQAHFLRAAPSR